MSVNRVCVCVWFALIIETVSILLILSLKTAFTVQNRQNVRLFCLCLHFRFAVSYVSASWTCYIVSLRNDRGFPRFVRKRVFYGQWRRSVLSIRSVFLDKTHATRRESCFARHTSSGTVTPVFEPSISVLIQSVRPITTVVRHRPPCNSPL